MRSTGHLMSIPFQQRGGEECTLSQYDGLNYPETAEHQFRDI